MGKYVLLITLLFIISIQYLFLGFEVTVLGWICGMVWLKMTEDDE